MSERNDVVAPKSGSSGNIAAEKWRQFWAKVYICVLFFQFIFPLPIFGYALIIEAKTGGYVTRSLTNDHPAKVLILFTLVFGVIWMTEKIAVWFRDSLTSPTSNSSTTLTPKVEALWCVIGVVSMVLVLISIYLEKIDAVLWGFGPIGGLGSLAMFLVFFGIACVAWIRLSHNPEGGTEALEKWGHLVTLAILLLAMMFLAIDFKHEPGPVKWEEIPAILMIYLLSDLGIMLVVNSRKLKDAVEQAVKATTGLDERVGEANKSLTAARTSLDELKGGTDISVDQLKTIVTAAKYPDYWRDVPEFCTTVGLEMDDYFKAMGTFRRSWTPRGDGQVGTLVGQLFQAFIGTTPDSEGTVRSIDSAVSCITSDSTFVQTSAEWLKRELHKGDKIVVWAITNLLPTQFAFPVMSAGVRSKNDLPMARFVTQVIDACKITAHHVQQYRRVTVFSNPEEFSKHADIKTATPGESFPSEGPLARGIDDVMIWDPHARGGSLQPRDVSRCCAIFPPGEATEPLEADGNPLPPPRQDKVSIYTTDFEPDLSGGILVAWKGYLRKPHPRGDTYHKQLHSLGWRSIREWYCESLHKPQAKEASAFWAVLKDDQVGFLGPLRLCWGQNTVLALDVLMIGRLDGHGKKSWLGAAISNLDLKRIECTIQLVTGTERLRQIETAVKILCNEEASPDPADVVRWGTWN